MPSRDIRARSAMPLPRRRRARYRRRSPNTVACSPDSPASSRSGAFPTFVRSVPRERARAAPCARSVNQSGEHAERHDAEAKPHDRGDDERDSPLERARRWFGVAQRAHRAPRAVIEMQAEEDHGKQVKGRNPPEMKAGDQIPVHVAATSDIHPPIPVGRIDLSRGEMEDVQYDKR